MPKMSYSLLLLLFFSPLVFPNASCKYRNSLSHCVNISFVEQISRRKDSKFDLKVLKLNGENISDKVESLDIELWMQMSNGHDHGSDKVLMKKNKKIFNISNVWLLMMGEWHIKYKYSFKNKSTKGEIPVCVGKTPEQSHLGSCSP